MRNAILIGAISAAVAVVLTATVLQGPLVHETDITIDLPARTAPAAPPLPDPPALPPGADAVPSLSFRATLVWQGAWGEQRLVQDVVRTADRVRIVPEGAASEWLFERNPVDTRRASGYLVDHVTRRVLVHQESDLRNRLELRGWADVLMMRFHPERLTELRPTADRERAAGATFVRYVTTDAGRPGTTEVWWSDTLLVPLRQTVREPERVVTTTLSRLSHEVDLAELGDPRLRFPEYDVLDVADQHEH
jgi:hypothetical protein